MNTNKKSELASLLRQLADFIERRSDEELAPLFQQAQRLVTKRAPRKFAKDVKPGMEEARPDDLAAQLSIMRTREAGEMLLREKIPNREGLERLARFLQLPVQRDDTVNRLRTKIVENSIGSRLRSEAIQGIGHTKND